MISVVLITAQFVQLVAVAVLLAAHRCREKGNGSPDWRRQRPAAVDLLSRTEEEQRAEGSLFSGSPRSTTRVSPVAADRGHQR